MTRGDIIDTVAATGSLQLTTAEWKRIGAIVIFFLVAILFWGGLTTMAGFALLLVAPIPAVAMSGFLLIGLGASNIVPVLFRGAGAQRAMPTDLAVAAIATAGYAGELVGPAAIGFIAKAAGLPVAFWLLAALVWIVASLPTSGAPASMEWSECDSALAPRSGARSSGSLGAAPERSNAA